MRGNCPEQVEKLFWPNGAAAGRAYNRDGDNDAYWPQNQAGRETMPAVACAGGRVVFVLFVAGKNLPLFQGLTQDFFYWWLCE